MGLLIGNCGAHDCLETEKAGPSLPGGPRRNVGSSRAPPPVPAVAGRPAPVIPSRPDAAGRPPPGSPTQAYQCRFPGTPCAFAPCSISPSQNPRPATGFIFTMALLSFPSSCSVEDDQPKRLRTESSVRVKGL
ncbi:hypothetical protein MTO96_011680 [Rhipicephalus appendiculatus]